MSVVGRHPSSFAAVSARVAAGRVPARAVWAMLFARLVLFAIWQAAIALVFLARGEPQPWAASVPWWPVGAALAGITNLALLKRLARAEGLRLRDLYGFDKSTWRIDLALTGAVLVASGPLVVLPMSMLSTALWHDPAVPDAIMIQPLPMWAVVAAIGFPVTISLTEMPTYLFVAHRLRALTGRRWTILILVGGIAAAQHITLPLVFDARFILYRLLALLPISMFWVAIMDRRPTMLPFMMVMHGLLDAMVVVTLASMALDPAPA